MKTTTKQLFTPSIFILFWMLLAPFFAHSQMTIEFSYDANGNRVLRELQTLELRNSERDTIEVDTLLVSEESETLEQLVPEDDLFNDGSTLNEGEHHTASAVHESALEANNRAGKEGKEGKEADTPGIMALANQVNIYPNPTRGAITVKHLNAGLSTPLQVFVRNSNSRLLTQFILMNSQEINLTKYANGVYYLELVAPNGDRETIRILKVE